MKEVATLTRHMLTVALDSGWSEVDGLRHDMSMGDSLTYVIVVSTVMGCVVLPWAKLKVAAEGKDLTFRDVISDRKLRGVLGKALLLLGGFAGIATVIGVAVAGVWWVIQGAIHNPPKDQVVSFMITGSGIGLIAGINLAVPLLGIPTLAAALLASEKGGRIWYQWLFYGLGFRRWRWPAVAFIFLGTLVFYLSWVVFDTIWSYWLIHLIHLIHLHRFPATWWILGLAPWRAVGLSAGFMFAGGILAAIGWEIGLVPGRPAIKAQIAAHPIGRIPFRYPPPPSPLKHPSDDGTS